MRLTILLGAVALTGCAVGTPHRPEDPMERNVHLHLATDGVRLGGYTFILKWDPKLATIQEIRPCSASKFPGRPEHPPPSHFARGQVRIWGITTDRHHDVPEEYDLATIRFRGHQPGKMPVSVQVEALYDGHSRPRPISGRLTVLPPELEFGVQP